MADGADRPFGSLSGVDVVNSPLAALQSQVEKRTDISLDQVEVVTGHIGIGGAVTGLQQRIVTETAMHNARRSQRDGITSGRAAGLELLFLLVEKGRVLF